MRRPAAAILVLLAGLSLARADELDALLERGPLVLVEDDAQGKLKQATALLLIDAPIAVVWAVLTDYDRQPDFVPKVESLEVVRRSATVIDTTWELDTPLSDTVYTTRNTLDPAHHTIEIRWVAGDLEGSFWRIALETRGPGRTLMRYSGMTRHYSAWAEGLEDERQTFTLGVNVGSLLSYIRAVASRAVALHALAPAAAPSSPPAPTPDDSP